MKITNSKKFEKTVKTLANFCKPHKNKKKPYDNRIFVIDNNFYSTNGHFMAILDVSDFVENANDSFSFPIDIKAAETIELKDDKTLLADGKEINFEQNLLNVKKVIPDGKPSAELSLDFSEHGWDIGFGKGASVYIGKDEAVFDYADDTECQYITNQCYETNADLLGNDYGDFQKVRFNMGYIKAVLKLSEKIKIQQFGMEKTDTRKIIAGDFEVVIVPMNY